MSDTPETTSEARLHAIIQGHVQGVYFRATTQREAMRLSLTGWVCNLWDGSVETVAEGPRAALLEFERYLHQGPAGALVEQVTLDYSPATHAFKSFNIRY